VRRVLLMEMDERERAAAELERLNMMEHAEALRAEGSWPSGIWSD
jgi:uncharacterized protein